MAEENIEAVPGNPVNIPAQAPQQIIIQQSGRRFGILKWLLGTVAVIAVFLLLSAVSEYQSYYTPKNKPKEKYHSLDKHAAKKLAIIDISGPIMEDEDGFVKRQIDMVREDSDVVAIVARIDSPGGTVTGSDFIYHHLRQLVEARKLPLVVSMGGVCASGGYYVSMAVGDQPNAIFAEPTTWTGSIGVIIPHFDLSGSLSALRIEDDSIASGPLKQMGSPTRPMTEDERSLLQQLVDESFQGFKEVVLTGRPKFKDDPPAFDAVATGQIFTANQALERGLVDKIGFLEAAITRALELAKLDAKQVRCVKYEESPSLFGEFMGADSPVPGRGALDVTTIVDLLTPRAYYLWTWPQAVMSNSR
jgi:protease-4